ncbi:MAG: DUF2059 domain-containing protein [Sphingomonadales bacterium]|nr:DUF2059 domain-containing protein [Sphingomonadales bacterium]
MVAEPDARALALAREIVRVGYPEDKRETLFGAAADAMLKQMREVMLAKLNNDPAAKAIIEDSIARFVVLGKGVMTRHIPAFMEGYAHAYAREFTPAELETILAFVRTPAGSHFFLRASSILSDPTFVQANAAYLRELQPLIDDMRESLTKRLLEYYQAHPPRASVGS